MDIKNIGMDALNMAIDLGDPYALIKDNCKIEGDKLRIFGKEEILGDHVYLISLGKAACSMARAMLELLGDRIEEGICVTRESDPDSLPGIETIKAGHPLPNTSSLKAGHKIIKLAKKAKENDTVITLISGGGSSLVEYPIDPISIEEMSATTELLIESGLNIHEINTVRRHLSKFKGGNLLKAIYPAHSLSIILSDVVGDNLEDIASGPTVKDPTTFQDAYFILKSHSLWSKISDNVKDIIEKGMAGEIEETLKKYPSNSKNFVISSKYILTNLKERLMEKYNIPVHIISTEIESTAKSWGLVFGSIVKNIKENNAPFQTPCILIASGELTVILRKEHGIGGPNQEAALAASIKIKDLNDVVILFADTDGIDGFTEAAGGIIDGRTYAKICKAGTNPNMALYTHDSHNALKNAGALIYTGSTGTNINDIYIAVIL